jgi:NADH-quinone oxidoreductase subunit L
MVSFDYIRYILLLPLIGSVLNGLFGKRIGDKGIGFIGTGVIGISFVISILSFLRLISLPPESRVMVDHIYTWVQSGSFRADISFILDPLSAVMILIVTGVGFVIHLYSIGYMHGDKGYFRYFSYLNLFIFSMLILVLGSNLLLLFVGWEGVGLCSYLLIGFWFEKKSASDAGKKAFIVNRIGDFGFALGIMLTFLIFKDIDILNIKEILSSNPDMLSIYSATTITLLLFIGATGKSAQIPLYVWLPDAMEGPTPVSALIHAATMVTAGVYMIARLNFLYELAPLSMEIVASIGALTAVFAATIALTQNDIKRVLAYSTISQLGYMFLAVGVGAFGAGIFHLMTHAFFKGLLFLGAGSVMHAMGGDTDMRNMGGLRRYMPITFITFLLATFAITGIPGFSGFFSKDEILWRAFEHHKLLWGLGVFGAFLTAFYMFRLLFMTFWGEFRGGKELEHHLHESPPVMTIPLIILGIFSAIGGYVGVPHMLQFSNIFSDISIERFFEPLFGVHHSVGSAGLEFGTMGISVIIVFIGILLAYYFYIVNREMPKRLAERFSGIYKLLLNKYYVDEIYNAIFVQPIKNGAIFLWKCFDTGVIDGIVNGSAGLTIGISGILRRIQTGYVQDYILSFIIGVILIIGYLLIYA